MEQKEREQFKKFRQLENKRLLWTGFDDATGCFLFYFEGGYAFSLASDGITELSDAESTFDLIVSENLDSAESILSLKKILQPEVTNDPIPGPAAVDAGAGAAPQTPTDSQPAN